MKTLTRGYIDGKSLPERQSGASLIEVLISMVLISIGLLGISASQISSLKLTHSAYQRSQATLLADDIADRMRANINEASKTATTYLTASAQGVNHGTNCVNYTGPLTNSCSTANMAEQDLYDWQQSLVQVLNGQGILCRDNNPNNGTSIAAHGCDNALTSPFVIKIWWNDDRDPSTPDQLFATSFEL
ncbi:MAG: type IV pilus modification protein PilV [Oceanospirillaceae bacterium]|nr:type IV pilus modification protein PilV [Oceanospirillaceae bacterium]